MINEYIKYSNIPALIVVNNGKICYIFDNLKNKTDFFIINVLDQICQCLDTNNFAVLDSLNQKIAEDYIDFVKKLDIQDNGILNVTYYSKFLKNIDVDSVIISQNILEPRVFYGNSNIKNVDIINCNYISMSCFEMCKNLKTVKIQANEIYIDKFAFQYCINLRTVVFDCDKISADEYSFYGCPYINKNSF